MLHLLVQTVKVQAEVESFRLVLKGLAHHHEYAPFAHIRNLSGVNNLEHGLFPHLSAVALGVTTAHDGILAGVTVREQYQQLREAVGEVERRLQEQLRSKRFIS